MESPPSNGMGWSDCEGSWAFGFWASIVGDAHCGAFGSVLGEAFHGQTRRGGRRESHIRLKNVDLAKHPVPYPEVPGRVVVCRVCHDEQSREVVVGPAVAGRGGRLLGDELTLIPFGP